MVATRDKENAHSVELTDQIIGKTPVCRASDLAPEQWIKIVRACLEMIPLEHLTGFRSAIATASDRINVQSFAIVKGFKLSGEVKRENHHVLRLERLSQTVISNGRREWRADWYKDLVIDRAGELYILSSYWDRTLEARTDRYIPRLKRVHLRKVLLEEVLLGDYYLSCSSHSLGEIIYRVLLRRQHDVARIHEKNARRSRERYVRLYDLGVRAGIKTDAL